MKTFLTTSLLATTLAFASISHGGVTDSPGYVDFNSFMPSSEGQVVEVKVGPGLIKFAAAIASFEDAEAAKFLRQIQHVHVNVVSLDDSNRHDAMAKVAAVRAHLEGLGWEPTVNVSEGANGAKVTVYVKQKGEAEIEGIVVTVIDGGREAVFVNVVGKITAEQLSALGNHLKIDSLQCLKFDSAQVAVRDR